MLLVVISLSCTIGLSGYVLIRLQRKVRADGAAIERSLSQTIADTLPGIQCGQCGYPGCTPYAQALADGEAPINLCSPGGDQLVTKLARLLAQEPIAVRNTPDGSAALDDTVSSVDHQIAWVRADDCIGCTLCLDACPVDAIIGAEGHLHTVIPDLCTGCQLCVQPCPTDCIKMVKPEKRLSEWEWPWVHPGQQPPVPR